MLAHGQVVERAALLLRLRACSSFSSSLLYSQYRHTSSAHSPVEDQDGGVFLEKRPSRRRFSDYNKKGRSDRINQLIIALKSKNASEAAAQYRNLMPREQLDIVRVLHMKRAKRRQDRASSKLPKYRSALFCRRYYFKEEDLEEMSTLGQGPGGQATNRRMQTVILKHRPSALIVKYSRFTSYWLNRRAARELLNLRLEEQLLGDESLLGRKKLREERRRARRQKTLARLSVKGNVLTAAQTHQRHYFEFLKGEEPLPQKAVAQLGDVYVGKPPFVSNLFDEECRNMWAMLTAAFDVANEGPPEREGQPSLPLVFLYMFPASAADSKEWECTQISKCAGDAAVRAHVHRALRCLCECFGIRLSVTLVSSDGGKRQVMVRDGLNWAELKGRMVLETRLGQQGGLTPFARVSWPRVLTSLQQLGMSDEVGCVLAFFKREIMIATKAGKEPPAWAVEGRTFARKALKNLDGSKGISVEKKSIFLL